jgi:sugar lactone lactonase YvrE
VKVRVLEPMQAELGEGPCWDAANQRLLWVDIVRRQVFVREDGSVRVFDVPEYVGAAVPTEDPGVLLLALGVGVATLDLSTGVTETLASTGADPARVRVNDAKSDPEGRFWVGTMGLDEAPGAGALYRLDGDGTLREVLGPVSISNGLAWSPDRRWMYYIDTPTRSITRFAFERATGEPSGSHTLVDTSPYEGFPDGMAADADGRLWVAFWDGGAVRCFDGASGALVTSIELPVTRPTNCTFAGPSLDKLVVTSARRGLAESVLETQELAGAVLEVDAGVQGQPLTPAAPPAG